MEIRHLESFVQTVNCNSFSKAAKLMQLSQPTVSSHINTLEKEMGTKLLVRTTKNMELTAKGRRFYEQVSEFLKMRDVIQQEFQDERRDEILIDASAEAVQWVLPQMLKSFGDYKDKVKYEIRMSNDETILHNVRNGLADIGLVDSLPGEENIVCHGIYDYSMVIAMPANDHYRSLLESDASLEELFRQPIILQTQKNSRISELDQILNKLEICKNSLQVVAGLQDCNGGLQYVANGLGIALTHELAAARFAQEGTILVKPIPRDIIDKKIYMVHSGDCDNQLVEDFVNHFMEPAGL